MVELVRAGRSPEELGREFEPRRSAIGRLRPSATKVVGPTGGEREARRGLRGENRRLRQEREILAIGEMDEETIRGIVSPSNACFARETGSILSGGTSS